MKLFSILMKAMLMLPWVYSYSKKLTDSEETPSTFGELRKEEPAEAADSQIPPCAASLQASTLGINLSPDFIYVAISTKVNSSNLLLKVEGDAQYKYTMRRLLPQRSKHFRFHGRKAGAIMHTDSNKLLRLSKVNHGSLSTNSLQGTLQNLKTQTSKAFGNCTAEMKTLLGVPVYVTHTDQEMLRSALLDKDLRVDYIFRHSALVRRMQDKSNPAMKGADLDNPAFVMELNRASLDLSITPTSNAGSDVLFYASFPNFGQDALDLRITETVLKDNDDTVKDVDQKAIAQPQALERISPSPRMPRKDHIGSLENRTNTSERLYILIKEVKEQHYRSLIKQVDEFIFHHTSTVDKSNGRLGKPMIPSPSKLLVAGDADSSTFEALQANFEFPLIMNRTMDQRLIRAEEIPAHGAALLARDLAFPLKAGYKDSVPLVPHLLYN